MNAAHNVIVVCRTDHVIEEFSSQDELELLLNNRIVVSLQVYRRSIFCPGCFSWFWDFVFSVRENDLIQQNLGLWSARHRAHNREVWSEIVETATLLQGHAILDDDDDDDVLDKGSCMLHGKGVSEIGPKPFLAMNGTRNVN